MSLDDIISILQISICPVILISGVGLLLLSMTNRLGRIIDRARELSYNFRSGGNISNSYVNMTLQVQTLFHRANIVRLAIGFAGLSIFFSVVLIIILFLILLFHLKAIYLISILFISCILSLMTSLIFFLIDINISLKALKFEIDTITDNK